MKKVCPFCNTPYSAFVEYCFRDGELLVEQDAELVAAKSEFSEDDITEHFSGEANPTESLTEFDVSEMESTEIIDPVLSTESSDISPFVTEEELAPPQVLDNTMMFRQGGAPEAKEEAEFQSESSEKEEDEGFEEEEDTLITSGLPSSTGSDKRDIPQVQSIAEPVIIETEEPEKTVGTAPPQAKPLDSDTQQSSPLLWGGIGAVLAIVCLGFFVMNNQDDTDSLSSTTANQPSNLSPPITKPNQPSQAAVETIKDDAVKVVAQETEKAPAEVVEQGVEEVENGAVVEPPQGDPATEKVPPSENTDAQEQPTPVEQQEEQPVEEEKVQVSEIVLTPVGKSGGIITLGQETTLLNGKLDLDKIKGFPWDFIPAGTYEISIKAKGKNVKPQQFTIDPKDPSTHVLSFVEKE